MSAPSPPDLAAAARFWREFDLEMRQDVLAKTVEVVAENERRSLAHRKELSASTKAFRGMPQDDRLKRLGPFVKSWQREVDDLTARAQFAEKHLLELARELARAPSNTGAICAAAETDLPVAAELRRKNNTLRDEIKELEKEFEGLSNQDITIQQRGAIATREGEHEDKVEEVADARMESSRMSLTRKVAAEEDANLKRQATAARELEVQAQTRADVAESRLFAERSRAEEQLATLQSDLEELSKAQVAAVARAESAEQRLALLDAGVKKNIPIAGSSRRKAATGGDKKGDGIEAGSGESGESEAQQQLLQHLQDELMVKNAQLLRSAAELEKLRASNAAGKTSEKSAAIEKNDAVSANTTKSDNAAGSTSDDQTSDGGPIHDAALRRALEDKTSQVDDLESRMEAVQEAVLVVARQVLTSGTRENLLDNAGDNRARSQEFARRGSRVREQRHQYGISLDEKTEQLRRLSESEGKLQSSWKDNGAH